MTRFLRPLDVLVVAGVLAAAAWSFTGHGAEDGSRAVVYISNARYGWYDLTAAPREVVFPTRIGPVRARIGGGAARVLQSPCPNKLCVRHGEIRHRRAELICMPARLLIVVEGGERDGGGGGVDAVTQ